MRFSFVPGSEFLLNESAVATASVAGGGPCVAVSATSDLTDRFCPVLQLRRDMTDVIGRLLSFSDSPNCSEC